MWGDFFEARTPPIPSMALQQKDGEKQDAFEKTGNCHLELASTWGMEVFWWWFFG